VALQTTRQLGCAETDGLPDGIIRAMRSAGETDMTTEHTTEAVVHARRTGVNGIPDLPVDADVVKQPAEDLARDDRETFRNRAASAETATIGWLAVGAVAVGVIFACLGLTQLRRLRRPLSPLGAVPDPHALTPPHGDKLMRRQ
jgi:hypothetical protein